MSDSKLTLIGMYNYDSTLFDLLTVPEGIDKATLIDSILLRSGEFEVLYPDMDFLKYSIGAWSRKWQPTFLRWMNVLSLEYDPIENYNRYEDWTDNRNLSGTENTKRDTSASENSTKTGTENRSEGGSSSGSTSGSTGSTTTNSVSAYDATTYSPKDQTIVSATDGSTNSGTTSLVVSAGDTMSLTVSSGDMMSMTVSHMDADDLTHSGRIHGNIGVMSTQNMVVQELDLGYWNIYEKITDIFLTEFVIPVY